MNFSTYLNQAWQDHANNSPSVADQFSIGLGLATSNEELTQLVGLITHVMGEHLGEWDKGVEKLDAIKTHGQFVPKSETENAIERSTASLRIGSGQDDQLSKFSLSDHIRILSVAASALSERDTTRAEVLLERAISLASEGLEKNDPANRALAITGNNLACALEEKSARSDKETRLMILAAKTGRIYWERAGTWLEISRAEYRLAMSYLKANELGSALEHAQICVELCRDNGAGDLDLFYAYESLATVERARGNELGFQTGVESAKNYFRKLTAENKSWCEPSLKKIVG